MRNFGLFLALAIMASVSAHAGETLTETYCFKLPAALKGGVTKIKATFAVDRIKYDAQTREVMALEVLDSKILCGARGANYFPNPYGDRRKLIGGRLVLENEVLVKGMYMVSGATFMASVRDLINDRYTPWHNNDTAEWSGVHPDRPHLRFEDGEALLADVIGKKCR